ncbi:uncharacterized protein LOC135392572 [Ornithodoros turicata]|uniref:uncharacterized protein LOC135392572 n=1 Tax=Ornithodoros turicata TaxID=34597 RepID=UPI0031390C95
MGHGWNIRVPGRDAQKELRRPPVTKGMAISIIIIISSKMAAYARLKIERADLNNTEKIHLLPCEIKHSGKAKVSNYFETMIEDSKEFPNTLKSSFRGRPLLGRDVSVPADYKGVVFKNLPTESGETKSFYARCGFDKLTYWKWSHPPSGNDKVVLMQDWFAVAKALHGEDSDEES